MTITFYPDRFCGVCSRYTQLIFLFTASKIICTAGYDKDL